MIKHSDVLMFKSSLENSSTIKELGYEFKEPISETDDNILGTIYHLIFIRSNRIVTFAINSTDQMTSVSVNIKNDQNNSIMLTDWMTKYSFNKESSFFSWSNDLDFNENLNFLVDTVNTIFKNDNLRPILAGEKWEHIPFSWFGQRP